MVCTQHAEWYGYDEKVKPQSQHGEGGRTTHKLPPWMATPSVKSALAALKQSIMEGDSAGDSAVERMAMGIISSETPAYPISPCYCRAIPWSIASASPLLAGIEPQHCTSCLSLCESRDSEQTLRQLLEGTNCDIVLGTSLRINTSDLCHSVPEMRVLGLADNLMKAGDIDQLSDWIKGSTKLQALTINRNSINDDAAAGLADGVRMCTSLSRLLLNDNAIGKKSSSVEVWPWRHTHTHTHMPCTRTLCL